MMTLIHSGKNDENKCGRGFEKGKRHRTHAELLQYASDSDNAALAVQLCLLGADSHCCFLLFCCGVRLRGARNPSGTDVIPSPQSKHDDEYEQTQRGQPTPALSIAHFRSHSPLPREGGTRGHHKRVGNAHNRRSRNPLPLLLSIALRNTYPFPTHHQPLRCASREIINPKLPAAGFPHAMADTHTHTHKHRIKKYFVFHDHSPAQRTAVVGGTGRGPANPLAMCNKTRDDRTWHGGAEYAMVSPQCALSLVTTKLRGWWCASKRALSVWTLGHVSPYLEVGA